jgi:hypothetical protein
VIEPMPIVLPRMNWAHCTILLSRGLCVGATRRSSEKYIEPCLLAPFYSASHIIILCVRYDGGALSFPPFFTCTVSSRYILSFPPYLDISFCAPPFSLLLAFGLFWQDRTGANFLLESVSAYTMRMRNKQRSISFCMPFAAFLPFCACPSTKQNPALSTRYRIHHPHP